MRWHTINRLIRFGYRFVYRSKGRFYLYLALFCSVLVVLDATTFHLVVGMKHRTFDVIMKHRIIYREADPGILLVDIDEGSLAAMAEEHGRWPWPRQVFAEFVEILAEQQPKAIIFDILFSDPDVYNPDSDAYFNEVIADTDRLFFPMLRLNPNNDGESRITPAMIPGVQRISGAEPQDKSIALILPHFSAAIEGGRLGTNNIFPDKDGIVRQYMAFRDHHGWRIPSMPWQIGTALNWTLPQQQNVLLNWRGVYGAFPAVRFSDLLDDFLRRERQRPQDEFKDKIVIIGSSAPALFDTKPTPMERVHPGVEILATAIDNFRNGDWITQPSSPWLYSAIALVLIWLVALAFLTGVKRSLIDGVFAGSQVGLIAVSYASLNLSTYYIDLTAPITVGFIYFSLARVYAYAEVVLAEKRVWLNLEGGARGWQETQVAVLRLKGISESAESKLVTRFKRDLNSRKEGFTVEPFPHKPAGIGRAYGDLLLVYYVDSKIIDQPASAHPSGDDTPALVREVAAAVFGEGREPPPIGSCRGAMPYDQEAGRIDAWRRLVTHAIQDLQSTEDGATDLKPGE
ncbi:MAG: CHASE2 domain-containing protein [Gammaproteobacteria bacterium]|nr:CHASE2 domain-containing protein [Gammaproteobacteria bacterium]